MIILSLLESALRPETETRSVGDRDVPKQRLEAETSSPRLHAWLQLQMQ